MLDALDQAIERGEVALAESPTGAEAIRRYLHDAVDAGLGVVNVVHPLLDDTDWPDRRAAAQDVLDRLVAYARSDGTIDAALTANEVALATIRFSRPLAVGLDPADERAITHRQLDRYVDGLTCQVDTDTEAPNVPIWGATSGDGSTGGRITRRA